MDFCQLQRWFSITNAGRPRGMDVLDKVVRESVHMLMMEDEISKKLKVMPARKTPGRGPIPCPEGDGKSGVIG